MLHFESPLDITLFVIEIIGCLSFGTSGAITAIRKKTDVLGVLILTFLEAFAGGMLRDVFINDGAPRIFWDPEFHVMAAITLGVAFIWFLLSYFRKTAGYIEKHRQDAWITLVDALGISAFTICGCRTAFNHVGVLPADTTQFGVLLFVASLGVLTGVGGGVIRDVCLAQIPLVFRKRFYMTPCILGSVLFVLMRFWNVNEYVNVFVCFTLIVALRTLAYFLKWNLPTSKGYNAIVKEEEAKLQRKE